MSTIRSQDFRETLWTKLREHYNRYSKGQGELSKNQVEAFLREILCEHSKQELDYVLLNFFRVDLNSNGTVFFLRVGQFPLQTASCRAEPQ
jgi:Ca2+-binding EF-hand superfamily protein